MRIRQLPFESAPKLSLFLPELYIFPCGLSHRGTYEYIVPIYSRFGGDFIRPSLTFSLSFYIGTAGFG